MEVVANTNTNWDGTITIHLQGANKLKIADLMSSDPYCNIQLKEKHIFAKFSSKVVNSNLNPSWKEDFRISIKRTNGNPIQILFTVWDKDFSSEDDFLGQCEITITPTAEILGQPQVLPLQPRNSKDTVKGTLQFTISYSPKHYESYNKYRYHNHAITGIARSVNTGERTRMYGTYEVTLHHVPEIFGDSWQHWNTSYDAAKTIFGSSVISGTVATQHKHLYSEVSVIKNGLMRSGDDLLDFLKNGIFGGKPRFFTYALMDHSWFFSETGAAFFTDFTSKHAMHACVSEVVRYAGEFHFQKNEENGKYRLVIDNNSGTYAPNKELLPSLKNVFELNFPGLEVEVLDFGDPKLKEYKEKMLQTTTATKTKK